MRPAVEVTHARIEDADYLGAHLRQEDLDELRAAGHDDPLVPIREGILGSDWAMTARVDGQIACVFGLSHTGSVLAPIGVPWMLGTDLVTHNARALMRLAPAYIAHMLLQYDQLINAVHAPNRQAIGWLRRMGFKLEPARPLGPLGEPFHVFRKYRHV